MTTAPLDRLWELLAPAVISIICSVVSTSYFTGKYVQQILTNTDRIIVLENGKVVMDGPRDAILHQHGMAPQKTTQRTVTMKPAAVAEEGAA